MTRCEMLRLDVNSSFEPILGRGLAQTQLQGLEPRIRKALADLEQAGPHTGFVDLPFSDEVAMKARRWAEGLPAEIRQVVVMGIGGSSLGPLALYESAHAHRLHCAVPLPPPARRLIFLDNSDPDTVDETLGALDPRQSVYVVITKSGSTAETASQLMIAWQRAQQVLGEHTRHHFLFITDPEKGDLRELARRLRVESFAVPPNVGGRFSVLSAVGLVPAAAAGLDPVALIQGAAGAHRACTRQALRENPAALLACITYLMDTRLDRHVHVIMAYSDRLARVGAWFRQLWAESLGKPSQNEAAVGPTPLDARGATDQHSLLQLLMQGPPDKFLIFLDVQQRATRPIPELFEDLGSFGYLGGHDLGQLIAAQKRGTEASLARAGTPSVTLTLEDGCASSVAALLQVLMMTTAIAGALYDIDPYNQPGVEESKRLTCGLFGRSGYERERREAEQFASRKSEDLVCEF